jgi:hypothetical protein
LEREIKKKKKVKFHENKYKKEQTNRKIRKKRKKEKKDH